VVRDTKTLDELIESTRGIIMSPEQLRAQRRSFAYGNTAIENPDVTRDIVASRAPTSSGFSARND
jgi:hypothetical protein